MRDECGRRGYGIRRVCEAGLIFPGSLVAAKLDSPPSWLDGLLSSMMSVVCFARTSTILRERAGLLGLAKVLHRRLNVFLNLDVME